MDRSIAASRYHANDVIHRKIPSKQERDAYTKGYKPRLLQRVITTVPCMATYTGKPCVYVRELPDGTFYVGRSRELHVRYRGPELEQIIYFEEFENNDDTFPKELELIREFLLCGIPLKNKDYLIGDNVRNRKSHQN